MVDPKKKRYLYLMLAGFGAISLSILLFFVLDRMSGISALLDRLVSILSPFIYGGVVAYLLRPLCNTVEGFLERHLPTILKKTAPILAIIVSFLAFVFIVYALIAMIVPKVYYSLISLWNAIPSRVDTFLVWAESTFGEDEKIGSYFRLLNTSYEELYQGIDAWFRENLGPRVTALVSGVGSSVFKILRVLYDLLIGVIVAVYLLFSRKRFARQGTLIVRSIFSRKWADAILDEFKLIDSMFGGFIDSKILDSAIIGILCYVGCNILTIPNSLLVSVFVGVTNVIPFFGPFIGAIPSTLLILIDDPMKAVWFVVFVLVLQQLDGNVIGPRIMGDRIGLSGFWVLFAIIFFGGSWGLVGMIVGVPLTAVIYDLARKLVQNGLRKRGRMELWEAYAADYPGDDGKRTPKKKKSLDAWRADFQQLFAEIRQGCADCRNWLVKLVRSAAAWFVRLWQKVCGFFAWLRNLPVFRKAKKKK